MPGQVAVDITVPNVRMSLEQLLAVIRQLDETARAQIARALLESKMDDELSCLLQELSQTPPADDPSSAMTACRPAGTVHASLLGDVARQPRPVRPTADVRASKR